MTPETWLGALDRAGFEAVRAMLAVLWQSSILLATAALMAWALRRRRASVRHGLWVSALLVAPLLPVLGWAAASLQAPRAEIPVMPAYTVRVGPQAPAQVAPGPGPRADAAAEPPAAQALSLADYPWAAALAAYAAGAAVLVGLVLVGQFRIRQWVRRGRVVTDRGVLAAFAGAQRRLRLAADFTVVENPAVRTPMSVGAMHPVILLPAGFARNVSAAELESVALHELAHARRYDPLLLGLVSVVRALLFFHPLVWLASRQVSMLAETACDDAVLDAVGEPVSYARLLARLAEALPQRALQVELASGLVLSKGAFVRRIEAILSTRRRQIRRLSRVALAATLIGAAASVALALALPLGDKAAPPAATSGDAAVVESPAQNGPAATPVRALDQALRDADPSASEPAANAPERAPDSGAKALPAAGPQILIEARILAAEAKAEKQVLDALAKAGAALREGDSSVVLTDPQAQAFLKRVPDLASVQTLSTPKVMTLDGQEAVVQVGAQVPVELPLPSSPATLVRADYFEGTTLSMVATISADARSVSLRVVPRITQLERTKGALIETEATREVTSQVPSGSWLLVRAPSARNRLTSARTVQDPRTGKTVASFTKEPAAGPAGPGRIMLLLARPTVISPDSGDGKPKAGAAEHPAMGRIVLDSRDGRVRMQGGEAALAAGPKPPSAADAAGWGPAADGLQTRLRAEGKTFRAGHPIPMKLEIRNAGNRLQRYHVPQVAINGRITVTDAQGKPVPYVGGSAQTMNPLAELAPGAAEVLDTFDLAAYYYLRQPGRYTATWPGAGAWGAMGLPGLDEAAEEADVAIPASNTVAFEVLPDPAAAADGDPVGRLLPLAKNQWSIDAMPSDEPTLRPGGNWGRVPGRQFMFLHCPTHLKDDMALVWVWVTKEKAPPAEAASDERSERPSEYVGSSPVGHVYVHVPAKALQRWPTAKADILRALQTAPAEKSGRTDAPVPSGIRG